MKSRKSDLCEDQRSTFVKNMWIYNSWSWETGAGDGQEEDDEPEK